MPWIELESEAVEGLLVEVTEPLEREYRRGLLAGARIGILKHTPQAFRLLGIIRGHCLEHGRRHYDGGMFRLSIELGLSLKQTARYLRELQGAGLVRVKRRGCRNSRIYPVAHPDLWPNPAMAG